MVDFNNDQTVGTKAVDIERVLILERRESVLQANESYNKLKYSGASASLSVLRARLINFLDQITGMFLRREGEKKLNKYYDIINDSPSYKDLHIVIRELSVFLDGIQLTRLDHNQVYDTTDIEAENEIKGLD